MLKQLKPLVKCSMASMSVMTLAMCGTLSPASVQGECGVFNDPGFAVQGKRIKDSKWIDGQIEKGISVCGWSRPMAE